MAAQGDAQYSDEIVLLNDFANRVREGRSSLPGPLPRFLFETLPSLATFSSPENLIRVAKWGELPPETQSLFGMYASLVGPEAPTGQQLFEDLFYRFFFIHELAHWLARPKNEPTSATHSGERRYTCEENANRVAVAYWRARDPSFLRTTLERMGAIRARLGNPVPAGEEAQDYFDNHYQELGDNPSAYGWFQLGMVLDVAAENPAPDFVSLIKDDA